MGDWFYATAQPKGRIWHIAFAHPCCLNKRNPHPDILAWCHCLRLRFPRGQELDPGARVCLLCQRIYREEAQ